MSNDTILTDSLGEGSTKGGVLVHFSTHDLGHVGEFAGGNPEDVYFHRLPSSSDERLIITAPKPPFVFNFCQEEHVRCRVDIDLHTYWR